MNDKKEALFIKYPLIVNGIEDRQGDVVESVTNVKKIFTNNEEIIFDEMHQRVPLEGVSIQESYINEFEENISGNPTPPGSWVVVLKIDNPIIQEKILPRETGGSEEYLGLSIWNDIKESCRAGLTGQIRYEDLPDAECAIPKFISFVDKPANGIGLHVMDYEAYISKSDNMSSEIDGREFLEKIAGLLGFNKQEVFVAKSEEIETPTEEKKEETKKEENKESETPKTEKMDVEVEEKEPDVEISKSELTLEDLEAKIDAQNERIAKLEEVVKQGGKNSPKIEKEEKKDKTKKEEEPKIVKSSKIVGKTTKKAETKNYYEMTGRDPITGCKIRK